MFWNPQRREVVGISRLIFHLNCASTVVLTVLMGNDGRCESMQQAVGMCIILDNGGDVLLTWCNVPVLQ